MKLSLRSRFFRSGEMPRRPEARGIALIVTLIMLSVITFLTVTFLVLSQRERNSVTTNTEQAIARQHAESAVERAKIELLAPMLASTNPQVYDLLVSTNFINRAGFNQNLNQVVNPYTNVNYEYLMSGGALNANHRLWILTNLFYNPRPPVFVTNRISGGYEFRYFLDLNRNRRFDTNGWLPEMGLNGQPIVNGGVTNYGWYVGDPEWIGVLERPDQPHSSSNRFIGRYAYLVVPAGKTLDVNYIHNQAKRRGPVAEGFLRNQGVGSYEINLAAFLTDLNTNQWHPSGNEYDYRPLPLTGDSRGVAFEDALSILRYRYANSYLNLFSPLPLVDRPGIDEYANGRAATPSLMTGTTWEEDANDSGDGFPGADNPNHFFTTQELFDRNKITSGTPVSFVDRLMRPGTNDNSYDRYTFYRMLSQLGTDSAPDGRINVNYVNVDATGKVVPGLETNQISWAPEQFFNVAADRLLREHSRLWLRESEDAFGGTFGTTNTFGLTNIPVLTSFVSSGPSGLFTNNYFGYTPAVHRLLQVVANIYDACGGVDGTNRIDLTPTTLQAPHVYRPIFRRTLANDAVYIVGYREVTDERLVTAPPRFVDMLDPADRFWIPVTNVAINADLDLEPMVHGVPVVVGAKKGFPGFSKFALQNAITATRKLFFHREPGQPVNRTNQVHSFAISNSFGVQAWNSYSVAFPRPVRVKGRVEVILQVTNDVGSIAGPNGGLLTNLLVGEFDTNILAGRWGKFLKNSHAASFIVPLLTNSVFLTNSEYIQAATRGGSFVKTSPTQVDPDNVFRVPQLWLNVRTRVRFAIIDPGTGTAAGVPRILDYVNLDSSEAPINLIGIMRGDDRCDGGGAFGDGGEFWCTNRVNNPQEQAVVEDPRLPTMGMHNQIRAALPGINVPDRIWKAQNAVSVQDKDTARRIFYNRLRGNSADMVNPADLDFGSPFQPTRTYYQRIRWEVNDPLVHYMQQDLTDILNNDPNRDNFVVDGNPVARLKSLSDHHLPWGGKPDNQAETAPPTQHNPAVKDPLMTNSDGWNFPTNRLPNIGWLGRVHRGTPWQTIYLKSDDLGAMVSATNSIPLTNSIAWTKFYEHSANTWLKWSGHTNYLAADAFNTRPARDRLLFDTFTASLNDNASRGRLSVNQSGLAAWSAVLSGVNVMTNSGASLVIDPAAVSGHVARIVNGINNTRAATNLDGSVFPQRQFQHVGDILAVPELTFRSPFINTNQLASKEAGLINDEILERIPQQIMSLLGGEQPPRWVIYSYGQSLRPAEQSVIRSFGPFSGICTNYQVTAESAIRVVMKVEGSFDPRDHANVDPARRYPPRIVTEQFNYLPPD